MAFCHSALGHTSTEACAMWDVRAPTVTDVRKKLRARAQVSRLDDCVLSKLGPGQCRRLCARCLRHRVYTLCALAVFHVIPSALADKQPASQISCNVLVHGECLWLGLVLRALHFEVLTVPPCSDPLSLLRTSGMLQAAQVAQC